MVMPSVCDSDSAKKRTREREVKLTVATQTRLSLFLQSENAKSRKWKKGKFVIAYRFSLVLILRLASVHPIYFLPPLSSLSKSAVELLTRDGRHSFLLSGGNKQVVVVEKKRGLRAAKPFGRGCYRETILFLLPPLLLILLLFHSLPKRGGGEGRKG